MSDSAFKVVVDRREDAFEIGDCLRANDVRFEERIIVRKSMEEVGAFLAEFVFSLEVRTAALGALGGWLAARQGRKVRIKIGDVEAEATSVKELKSILEIADERTATSGPDNDSDSTSGGCT